MLSHHLLETLYAADDKSISLQMDIHMGVPVIDADALPPPPALQRQRRYAATPLNEASRITTNLLHRRPHMRHLLTQWAAMSSKHLPHAIKADIQAIRGFVATRHQDRDLATLYLLRELERLVGDAAKTATLNLAIRQLIVDGAILKEYSDEGAKTLIEVFDIQKPYTADYDPEEAYMDDRYARRVLKSIQEPEVYEWRLGAAVSLAEYLPALHTDIQLALGAATSRVMLEDEHYRKWRRYAAFAAELHRRLPILQHVYSAWLEPEDAAAAAATTAPIFLNARILDQYLLLSTSLEESAAAGFYAGILSSPIVPPPVEP